MSAYKTFSAFTLTAAFTMAGAFIPLAQEAKADIVTVIDFETPDVAVSSFVALPLVEDGFTLTGGDPNGNISLIESDNSAYTGSQSVGFSTLDSTLTLSINDPDSSFVPLSIDIADIGGDPGVAIPFTGITTTGAIVNDALTTNGIPDAGTVHTFNFNITDDLTSLTFPNAAPGFLYDNITLDVTSVPEPSTLALFGLGAGALLAIRRREDKPAVATQKPEGLTLS